MNPSSSRPSGAISACFPNRRQAQKALNDLQAAGFLGSEMGLASCKYDADRSFLGEARAKSDAGATPARGVMVTVVAGARGADADRILRAAGGEPSADNVVGTEASPARTGAATDNVPVSSTARAIVAEIEGTERGVPPTAPRPHGGDDRRSGRLIS